MGVEDVTGLPQEPLDRLSGHVNTVLIQIGRIFQHSVRSDNKTWSRAKNHAHEVIPKTNRQFHETLDEVEIQLMNAKSVLERDLASIRAKRAERENALRAERLRASGKETLQNATGGGFTDNDNMLVKLEANNEASKSTIHTTGREESHTNGNMVDITAVKSELFGDKDGSVGQGAMTIEPNQATATNEQNPQDLKDLGMAGDIFSDNLGPTEFANLSTDADLDSMFNDPSANGADSLNFDLDFSGNNTTSEGLLAENVSGAATSSGDLGHLDATSSEDINSLLPGLESLVNADGEGGIDDFTMLDVPADDTNGIVTTSSAQQQTSTAQQSAPVTSTAGGTSTATADPDFDVDDMFFGTDSLDMGGTGEIDFDQWFN